MPKRSLNTGNGDSKKIEQLTKAVDAMLARTDGVGPKVPAEIGPMVRIAANLISDRGQRAGREPAADNAIEVDSLPGKTAELADVERRATLFRLVDTLPAEQRRVVVLRFVEEKSIKEVAREIRKTEGAVKQLQFRALTTLRTRMEGADA